MSEDGRFLLLFYRRSFDWQFELSRMRFFHRIHLIIKLPIYQEINTCFQQTDVLYALIMNCVTPLLTLKKKKSPCICTAGLAAEFKYTAAEELGVLKMILVYQLQQDNWTVIG